MVTYTIGSNDPCNL